MTRTLTAISAVVLGITWSIAVTPTVAVAATTYPYVNMGDSLSSGEGTYRFTYEGTTDQENNRCHRSVQGSYSAQYRAISINTYALTNVACSGASTYEIDNVKDPNSGGIRDSNELAQDQALGDLTKLVTISIGINDFGLLGFASECYNKGNEADENYCFTHIEDLNGYSTNLQTLPSNLHKALGYVKDHARNAMIAVLTYPQIYPSAYTGGCQQYASPYNNNPLVTSQAMLTKAQSVLSTLNTAIRNEVNVQIGSGGRFILVDIETALVGHDVCTADANNRWVNQITGLNPISQTVDPESLHPNAFGYYAIAKVLAKRLDAGYLADGTVNSSIVNAYKSYGGSDALGYPANNGGGTFVHYWDGPQAMVQDFTYGSYGPSILVQGQNASYLVSGGFRDAYVGGNWNKTCLAPLTNSYASGGGTRQDFVNCYMTWTQSGGVVVHGPNPNTCTNYGGKTMTGPNACVGFYTTSVWFSGGGIGLYGKEIWTYANGTVRDSTANYTLHGLDPTHAYTLQAYIPNGHSNASHAHYHYCGTNGGCAEGYVNQNNFTNAWANFGTVCTSDGNATIMLADDGGDRYPIQVGADAIRAVKTGLLC